MQLSIALQGNLRGFVTETEKNIATGAKLGALRFTERAKLAFRDDVRKAGLGDRLANTWQGKTYPQGKPSASPAAFIYSKAPLIINAFTEGVTITHHDSLWLAIPTENTPNVGKGRGRRKASPLDVEVIFNQDLIIFPGRGRQLLAFVDVAAAKKTGRHVRDKQGRFLGGKGKPSLVLMFVLVPQVTLRKRLNWPQLAADLNETFADLIGSEVAGKLGT